MKITNIKIEPCILEKDDPTWRFALGASPVSEGLIISIETDKNLTGFGYASATAHMGASLEGLTGTLERLVPYINKDDPLCMTANRRDMDRALL